MPYRAVGVGLLLAICASSFFNSHFSTFTEGRLVYFWLGAMLASGGGALPLRNSGVETI
jgi:ABC-type molybdate transport system permease subunit